MKKALLFGMLLFVSWAFGQTPAEQQVEKTYKQVMKQLKKEHNLSEIHGKVFNDNSQWLMLKSADGHVGIATTGGVTVLLPKYNRITYYAADVNPQCMVSTKDNAQQLAIPIKPRQARFLSAIGEMGEIHSIEGSTLGSFLWKKGRSLYAIGNYLVYNYRKTNLKLRKNQKEDPNNSLQFYTDLSSYSDMGVMSLDGEELLPSLYNSITFYEACEEPSFTFAKDGMELTVPTEPHAGRYVATGLEIGGLYDTDFNPLATFPGGKNAKTMILGNQLIYNYEHGGIEHEGYDKTKPLTQFRFWSNNNGNIGVMTTDGEEIFQPIYSNFVHNLPKHYIIVTSKAQGRQLEAGFNTENPDDYVPLKYNTVFNRTNKEGKQEWKVRLKQLDTLQTYNPVAPLPIVYVNALDSLFEYNRYQEGIDCYRMMTAPKDYDKWIASHCLYEQVLQDILHAKVAPETYKLIKYFDTKKTAPDFVKAKDMLTEALQLASHYQEVLGDKANYIVRAFPNTIQQQLDGLPKVESDYQETALQYQRDLDEAARAKAAAEAEKRARAEAAQRAREERIAQAWVNVLSGVISNQVNRLMSPSRSGNSRSSSSGVRTSALPSTSSSSSNTSSSSNDSGRGELVTVEKHVQCGGCKGAGKTSKSRGLGDNYLVTCKVCDGKGYVIRYENVRK